VTSGMASGHGHLQDSTPIVVEFGGAGRLSGQPLAALHGRGLLTSVISISGASASQSIGDWLVNGGQLRPGPTYSYGDFVALLNSFVS
jgi:hypothetical protein